MADTAKKVMTPELAAACDALRLSDDPRMRRAGDFRVAVATTLFPALFWSDSRLDDAHPEKRAEGTALVVTVRFGPDDMDGRAMVRGRLRDLLRSPLGDGYATVEMVAARAAGEVSDDQ